MKKLDVLYTSDNRYLDIMLGSIISLIKNSHIDNLRIHIICENLSKNDYQKIGKVFDKYPHVRYTIYPIEKCDMEKYQLPDWRSTQIANARLFFTEIMKDNISDIDSLLYLDADTNVVGDLNSLDEYQDITVGACKDNNRLELLEKYDLPMYYNSGVLLINIDRWMEEECDLKLLEEVKQPHTELQFPDQDIINVALKNDIEALPIEYNIMPYEYIFNDRERRLFFNTNRRYRSYEEVCRALDNPKIHHGCGLGSIKPWSDNSINPFNEEFVTCIREANPDFTLEELSRFQKILNSHPFLLRKALILRTYSPQKFYDLISDISSRKQGIKTDAKQYRK